MRLFIVLFCALFLSACLTSKKREDITHRFLRENPKVLADLAQLHYPVQPRPGIPVVVRDTVIYHAVDTIVQDSIRFIRLETVKEIINNIHTTDTVPDYAQVDALMLAKFDVERKLHRAEVELEGEKEVSKNRRWWAIGLGAGLVVLLFINVYSFLKPKINV